MSYNLYQFTFAFYTHLPFKLSCNSFHCVHVYKVQNTQLFMRVPLHALYGYVPFASVCDISIALLAVSKWASMHIVYKYESRASK